MVTKKEMTKFISELEYAELLELARSVQERVDEITVEARNKAKAELEDRAKQLGFDLTDLYDLQRGRSAKGAKASGERARAAIKYENPKNPDQKWSGRGLTPRWITESGKDKSYFLIK